MSIPSNLSLTATPSNGPTLVAAPSVPADLPIELFIRTSSGKEFTIEPEQLTPEQLQRLQQLIGQMAAGMIDSFEVNLSTLEVVKDGKLSFASSDMSEIQELRDLVRKGIGNPHLPFDTYLKGVRSSSSSGEKPFQV